MSNSATFSDIHLAKMKRNVRILFYFILFILFYFILSYFIFLVVTNEKERALYVSAINKALKKEDLVHVVQQLKKAGHA